VVKAETIDPRDVPCHPAQGTSRILQAVLMPEDDAELLSDIRYIDEPGHDSFLRSRTGHRPTEVLFARAKNNFNGAGINANWPRSYR
jgi:hypothetical protein